MQIEWKVGKILEKWKHSITPEKEKRRGNAKKHFPLSVAFQIFFLVL